MSTIIRFGLDLAKNSCAVCGVDAREKIQPHRTLKRSELLRVFADRPAALVAMEAGSGARYRSAPRRPLPPVGAQRQE